MDGPRPTKAPDLRPVSGFTAVSVRQLSGVDGPALERLLAEAGAHGVYVANAWCLDGHTNSAESNDGIAREARLLGAFTDEGLGSMAFCGVRGNLIVVGDRLPSETLHGQRWPWRIALGPHKTLSKLAAASDRDVMVLREQYYFSVACDDLAIRGPTVREAMALGQGVVVRRALDADAKFLMRATLELNRADLGVDPGRVDRDWLARTVSRRAADGRTWVLERSGKVVCKLDVGCLGRHGWILEGVYTPKRERGRGHAARLVHAVAQHACAESASVALHCASDNAAAHRAYEKAGLIRDGSCSLLLLS